MRRVWLAIAGVALAAGDFAWHHANPPGSATVLEAHVIRHDAPSGLMSDSTLEVSVEGDAAAALLVVDADERTLGGPFWLERSRRRLQAIVPERALAPHATSAFGLVIAGGNHRVRRVLDRLTPARGPGGIRDRAAALAGRFGVRMAWLPLEPPREVTFDPSLFERAETALRQGDPGGALAMLDAQRGAVPDALGARADALAAEAAFAFGRVHLARSLAERGLALLGADADPRLEARLLRTYTLAFSESEVVTEPPPARERLRESEPRREDPIEKLLDAELDLRLAELHDRRTPEAPRATRAARSVLERAREVPAADLDQGGAALCRAAAHLATSDERAARDAIARGTGLARTRGRIADEALCAIQEGDLALYIGDLNHAEEAYERAIAILGDRPLPRQQREAWFSAAYFADSRGEHAKAAQLAHKAREWVDRLLDVETDFDAREAVFNNMLGYYVAVERFAIRAGDPRTAIVAGESGKARAFGALLAGLGHVDETAVGTWLRHDGGSAPTDRPDLDHLRGLLGPEDAALSYTQLAYNDNGLYELAIGVVTREGEHAVIVEEPPGLKEDVAALERAVEGNQTDAARAIGERLYATLVAPVRAHLAGRERLFVSPHLHLHGLPWGALHDGDHFLAERFAIARVPPLVLDRRERDDDRPAFPEDRPWLVASAPRHPGLPALPGLEPVADFLEARVRPVARLRGDEVVPSRLLDALGDVEALVYLGHARFDPERPLRSALLVSPSPEGDRVDAASILGLDGRLDLVVLVGCETARQWDLEQYSDEAIGLPRAFIAAGARHVVGALWPVIDSDAEDFVRALFSRPRDLDVVRAVGAAQACLARGECASRGVAAWGSFVVDAR